MSSDDQVCDVISTATPTVLPGHGAPSLSERHVMLLSCNMLVMVVLRPAFAWYICSSVKIASSGVTVKACRAVLVSRTLFTASDLKNNLARQAETELTML